MQLFTLLSLWVCAWSNRQKWERNFEDAEQRKLPLLAIIWRHSSSCVLETSLTLKSCPCLLLKRVLHSSIRPCRLSSLDLIYFFKYADHQILNISGNVNLSWKQMSFALASIFAPLYFFFFFAVASPHVPYENIGFLSGGAPLVPALHYQTVSTSWGQCIENADNLIPALFPCNLHILFAKQESGICPFDCWKQAQRLQKSVIHWLCFSTYTHTRWSAHWLKLC